MRGAVQKLVALALAAGLVAGGPVCSHAQMKPCSAAISHETKDVPIYADLNVDPADDSSLQAELPAADGPHHDDALCKKCCAICIGANLPAMTLALTILSAGDRMILEFDDNLVAWRVDGFAIGPLSLACGLAAAIRLPVITPDVTEEPRWKPWLGLAKEFDYRACWSFPVETPTGKIVGTFAMYYKEPREAALRDLDVAVALTRTAGAIISRH